MYRIKRIASKYSTIPSCFLLCLFLVLGIFSLSCEEKIETTSKVSVGQGELLSKYFLGANANLVSFNEPWDNDSLVTVTKNTGIRTLRYPGGTIGNYWDWDIGALDQTVPDSLMIKWVVDNGIRESDKRYTLENLATMYRKTGITPVFMLNMLSKDLNHSLRNLRKAKALGIPIKFIEMGNELYFNIPFPLLKFPTPESYGKTCQLWIEVLRQEFPKASYALVGTTMERHDRQIDWNKRVLKECTNADAMVVHVYSPSGLDGRLERKVVSPGEEGIGDLETVIRQAPDDLGERQQWELGLLKDSNAYANMFTTAEKSLEKLDDFYLPIDMDLWVTEFNIRDDNSVVLHSWAQTLILTDYYIKLLNSKVSISSVHNLTGQLFGMVHSDTLSYNHLKSNRIKSIPYTLSAGGMCTHLFGEAMKGMDESAELNFDNPTYLIDDRGAKAETLKGRLFYTGMKKNALIVNYGFKVQEILFDGSLGTVGKANHYSAIPSAPVMDFNHITTASIEFNGRLELPPQSITLIYFK